MERLLYFSNQDDLPIAPAVILFDAAQVAMSDNLFSDKDEEALILLQNILNLKPEEAYTIIQLAKCQRVLKANGTL